VGSLFGTDGVRGRWGEDLTPEIVRAVADAAARMLGARRVLIGRDTRHSGKAIERELVSGLHAAGAEGFLAGVIPTAAIAALVPRARYDAGIMISASHNPADDNGIKIFGADGMKLADAAEDEIEADVRAALERGEAPQPDGAAVDAHEAEEEYLKFLLDGAPSLKGLRIAIDCANGAAFRVAPEALRRAGADVDAINVEPDGRNINDGCGSTHPEGLQRRVVETRAHLGLAHDGDADRLIAVDERGEIVDGDQVLAICALDRKRRGALKGDAIVTTVMANLGLHQAMARHGVELVETAVGDRYVLEALRERDLEIGGEQSGHIIFLDKHTTGDGIITALCLLDVLVRADVPLSELAAVSPRLPQVLVNVDVADRNAREVAGAVAGDVDAVREELGAHGRVLVRPSGTEPVIRVMVQADAQETAEKAAERLAGALRDAVG